MDNAVPSLTEGLPGDELIRSGVNPAGLPRVT
jgi:hypothetical protein